MSSRDDADGDVMVDRPDGEDYDLPMLGAELVALALENRRSEKRTSIRKGK